MNATRVSLITCLLVCCLCIVATSARAAATIGPKLQAELDAANIDDVIPVIITLSDKANLKQFRDRDRSVRRSKLITALKSKATQSQKGLEGFLRARGATGIKRLWLTNSLAAHLPASAIRKVEKFPAVESIRLDYTVSAPVMAAAEPTLSIDDVTVDEAAGYRGVYHYACR